MPLKHKPTGAANASSVSGAPTTPAVLTVEDVAARLQISKASVYELTRFRQDPVRRACLLAKSGARCDLSRLN